MLRYVRTGLTLALTVGLIACLPLVAQAQASLDDQLSAIGKQYKEGADMKAVEAKVLDLVKSYKSAEDLGRIYAAIPLLYLMGYADITPEQRTALAPGAVLKYCMKAVEYPLDVPTASKVYTAWATTLKELAPKEGSPGFPAARRTAAMPLLTCLKLLLDNSVPADYPPEPPEAGAPPTGPNVKEALKKRDEAIEAHKKMIELVEMSKLVTSGIISLYADRPFATDELRELATGVLVDKSAVDQLVAAVEDTIKRFRSH